MITAPTETTPPAHAVPRRPRPAPRTAAIALFGALLAAGVAIPRRAAACIPDPSTGKCVAPPPTSHPYQVTGADGSGLALQATPHIGNVIRWAPNGTTLNVVCQVNNGDQADGRTQYGRPFRTWDQLNDGNFVYDWYLNTPTVATDGYAPGIAHCPGSNPQPPGGGAGPYQVTGTDADGLAVHSLPGLGGVLRWVPNGTSLTVSCQINDGAQVDGRAQGGHPFTTWDQLSDGTWVYDWYMTTQLVGGDGFSPGMPHCQAGGFAVLPTSPRSVHLGWTDATHGNATYAVTDEVSVRNAGQGATTYDWTGIAEDKIVCFQVRSSLNGYTSPWSAGACTRTPRVEPWCPSQEATHPACGDAGAFQVSCPIAAMDCTSSLDDFDVDAPSAIEDATRDEATLIVGGFATRGWNHAADFLANYLNAGGADWHFSSVDAYHQGSGFKAAVDAAAQRWIAEQRTQDNAFDSGYIDFPAAGASTATWNSDDWKNAVGHGFFRLVGARQASGAWSVQLQLTSYYQFRSGEDFDISILGIGIPAVNGAAFRRLHEVGYAQNFREIGTGTLDYGASGSPL